MADFFENEHARRNNCLTSREDVGNWFVYSIFFSMYGYLAYNYIPLEVNNFFTVLNLYKAYNYIWSFGVFPLQNSDKTSWSPVTLTLPMFPNTYQISAIKRIRVRQEECTLIRD